MVAYIDREGNEFELPKLTIALQDEMQNAPKGNDTKTQAKGIMAFLKKILPEDYVTEQLGSDKVEEIDLVALRNMYDGVDGAYTRAITESQMDRVNAQLEDVMPVLQNLEKVSALQNRQGFSRVR